MIPILRRLNDPFYMVMVHYNTFADFLTQYVLNCHVGTRIELQGCNWNDGILVVEFTRTQSGFLYNVEQEYNAYGRVFMSKYVSKENEWTLTPDAWFDMVINPFIRNFPMLKVHTPNTYSHLDHACGPRESVVSGTVFNRSLSGNETGTKPPNEGRRIFRNLMDLPPLENIEVASYSTQGNHMDRVDDSFRDLRE
ncbi:uncharacterized protein TNCV_1234401 [Trichonephila clavipes]|nr:uncharacterized protein TNCV_1234401 [Trichonephila clavipes]